MSRRIDRNGLNGRNNGGPWGAGGGSNGSGGGGNGPRPPRPEKPNIEELFKKGQEQFGGFLPGASFGVVLVLVALVLLWAFQSFYRVQPNQLGIEMFLGQPKAQLSESGLHFHFWPLETVEVVTIEEQQLRIGSIGSQGSDSGLMLSRDQNIVDVVFSVLWEINDPENYLFNVRDPNLMVRKVAESAMREVVGKRPAEDVFRDRRDEVALEVQTISQEILDLYGSGTRVKEISIEDVAPPAAVKNAFDEVQRAEQDEDRFQEQARKESNTILGKARGDAAAIEQDALAYKERVINEAEGESARFISVYEQYVKAPGVTRKRLFLETMEEVFQRSDKVILENSENGTGAFPFLSINELQRRRQGANQ